jgi:hypothetical protein
MKLYRAVVENNVDELKLGRVQVRVFGLHTANNESSGDFNSISKDALPWAEVIGSNEFGLVSGIGLSSVLRQGTWVWVLLEEDDPNKPIIIGTINGVNTEDSKGKYSSGQGFFDPDEVYPLTARIDETDINRLARNEKLNEEYYDTPKSVYASTDTIHKQINDNVDEQTGKTDSVTGADVSQTEPNSLDDSSEYPNSNILETQSGHVITLDDTTGNERIRVYHTSGSYIEIRPDGTFVQKSVNTNAASHYIHMSDVQEHIAKGVKSYIEENMEQIIGQNFMQNVKGDLKLHVEGNLEWQVGGNITINSAGTQTTTNGGTYTHTAPRIDLNP